MEYLDGQTLADVLADEPRLPVSWAVDILEQACSAVDEAHQLGIVHRDLKPDNIWLEPNRRGGYTVKVLDFGLAKLDDLRGEAPLDSGMTMVSEAVTGAVEALPSSPALTRAGSVMGTPLYMSPEQCRGEELDPRSDIYSSGVIAFRMLTGDTPFSGGPTELVKRHAESPPPHLRSRVGSVPRRLARVVMQALAKAKADRPQTAGGFASALRASSEGTGALLRQAVSLYSEHFPLFLQLSLVASLPLVAGTAALVLLDSGRLDDLLPQLSGLAETAIMFCSTLGPTLLAFLLATAAITPLVAQVQATPLRPLRISVALRAVRTRLGALLGATGLLALMVLGPPAVAFLAGFPATGFLLLVGLLLVAMAHTMFTAIASVEPIGPTAVLRRARTLVRRVWSTMLAVTVVQFGLPILVWNAAFEFDFSVEFEAWRLAGFGFLVQTSAGLVPYQLLNVLVTPLAAIMTARLYLKARDAGGETSAGSVR